MKCYRHVAATLELDLAKNILLLSELTRLVFGFPIDRRGSGLEVTICDLRSGSQGFALSAHQRNVFGGFGSALTELEFFEIAGALNITPSELNALRTAQTRAP